MKQKRVFLGVLLALLLAACVRKPNFSKCRIGDEYFRHYRWDYKGHQFKAYLAFPVSLYGFYDSLPKDRPYAACAVEDAHHPYMLRVVQILDSIAEPYDFDNKEMAEYLLAFVQSVPYARDPGGYGYNRPPILTLLDNGDCVDLSVCYCALQAARGQRTCLIVLPKHHHMVAGVEIPGYSYRGYMSLTKHVYCYAECTCSLPLGMNYYRGDTAIITEIKPRVTAWSLSHSHETIQCEMLPEVTVTAAPIHPLHHRKTKRHDRSSGN